MKRAADEPTTELSEKELYKAPRNDELYSLKLADGNIPSTDAFNLQVCLRNSFGVLRYFFDFLK